MSDSDDFEARFGRRAEDLGKFPDEWADPAGEDPDAGTFDAAGAGEAYVPATILCGDCGSTCSMVYAGESTSKSVPPACRSSRHSM